MRNQYYVPVNRRLKNTKHDWLKHRQDEGMSVYLACRNARMERCGVYKYDCIEFWKEEICKAEESIKKYRQLIDEAMRPTWESIDTSTT